MVVVVITTTTTIIIELSVCHIILCLCLCLCLCFFLNIFWIDDRLIFFQGYKYILMGGWRRETEGWK